MRPKPPARRPPVRLRARLRPGLALRRRPRLWWVVVVTAAATAGGVASSVVASAERARTSWGTMETVVVVERARHAGDELRPGDVSLVQRPRAMLPASALGTLPRDAVLRTDVVPGELLVAERLAPAGSSRVAALLPAGDRAVAVPTEPGWAPPLAVGDHVDVLVALSPEAAGDGPPGFVVAADALVLAVDDVAVTVAVPRDIAPRIAVALSHGAVTLALVGPR